MLGVEPTHACPFAVECSPRYPQYQWVYSHIHGSPYPHSCGLRSFQTLTGSPSLGILHISASGIQAGENWDIIPLVGSMNEDRMKQGAEAENVNLEVGTGLKKAFGLEMH